MISVVSLDFNGGNVFFSCDISVRSAKKFPPYNLLELAMLGKPCLLLWFCFNKQKRGEGNVNSK